MPLLQAEPDIFPATLLEAQEPGSGEWWVLYTLARKEKELCRQLFAREIPFFCPTVPRRYRSPGGRTRTSYLPLFPNYVFLRGHEEHRHLSLTTGCVSRSLPVIDGQQFLTELRGLADLMARGVPLTPEALLMAGMRVRVKTGPLQGIEGTVLNRRGEQRLLVAVNFIQRGASMELGDCELERLE